MKVAMAFHDQQMAHPRHRAPSPSPSPSPSSSCRQGQGVDFSPPVIAMVVVVAAAFIVVTYCRLISRRLIHPMLHLFRRRRRYDLPAVMESPSPNYYLGDEVSNYGLDEAAINTLPLSVYNSNSKKSKAECAVCLLEFGGEKEEKEYYVRTLPLCSHAFHVHCIDVWLKSHANCPLCRAPIFLPLKPMPMPATLTLHPEITEEEVEVQLSPPPPHNFLLNRSYSFGFERSIAAERLVQTASPWHHRLRMSSPLLVLGKQAPRVMSFRSYLKASASPLLIRRRRSLMSRRRSKWMAGSPSRMRCGDPEALVSPERLNRSRRC